MFCFPVVQPPIYAPPIPASLESELLTLLIENGFFRCTPEELALGTFF